MYTQEIIVNNEVGLHARPATFFIQKANEFKSGIWVEKEDRRVNAKSLLGVLSLGIVKGTTITLIADGADEKEAVGALVELVEAQMGVPVERWMEKIYDPVKGGRPFIASFAHNVFKARAMGDWAAGEIFDRGAHLLGDLTHAAAKWFDGEFPVAMNGGLVMNFPEYTEAIRKASHPRARMIPSAAPPVYGAAVEAMWDAGIECTKEFRKNFMESYNAK